MRESIEAVEAMRLINQAGTEIISKKISYFGFSDGDILLEFRLLDGSVIFYIGTKESDYYEGEYSAVKWEIERAKA